MNVCRNRELDFHFSKIDGTQEGKIRQIMYLELHYSLKIG